MGYGLLLIGYFMANILPVISFLSVAMPIGYAVMAVALWRLAPYERKFLFSFGTALVILPVSLYYAVYGLARLVGDSTGILSPTVFGVVTWLYFALSLAFTVLLLWAQASFARESGLFTVQSNAWRNLTFVGLYHLLYLAVSILGACGVPHTSAFVIPMTMLRYLCVFLNLWLFFRCYRYILPEGSDGTPSVLPITPKGRGMK